MTSSAQQFQKSLGNNERAQLICIIETLALHMACMAVFLHHPEHEELATKTSELSKSALDYIHSLPD